MSILFSGDFHAGIAGELGIITKKALINKYKKGKFDKIKYHIILGDGGFLWPGNQKTDLFNYKTLANRPFPILCVIGNHEPILGMSNLIETDIGIGETVYQINAVPFTAYLKRGKVYTIDGIKFLVLGGAFSIDVANRIPEISWWKEEYWSEKEKLDLFDLLKNENTFDFVISHTGPHQINEKLFESLLIHSLKINDEVALLNDEIQKLIQFKEWWCGHWHQDKYYYDKTEMRGYQYLYRTTKILDKAENQIVVYNEFGLENR
jgi:3-oxoacid CoA-transferase subunit A